MSNQVVSDTYTHLLQPDTVLPSQYSDALRRRSIQEPERRLVIALLEDAVDCFTKHMFSTDRKQHQLYVDAEAWFGDGDRTWPFAFENVCELLNMHPEYVRRGLAAWKDRALEQRAATRAA